MRSVILSKWDTVAGNERSSWACLMLLDMYQDVAEVSAKKDLNKKTNKPKTTCMPQPLGIYMKTFCMLHVFVIVFVCVFGRPFELSLADGWTLSVWRTFFFLTVCFSDRNKPVRDSDWPDGSGQPERASVTAATPDILSVYSCWPAVWLCCWWFSVPQPWRTLFITLSAGRTAVIFRWYGI